MVAMSAAEVMTGITILGTGGQTYGCPHSRTVKVTIRQTATYAKGFVKSLNLIQSVHDD